MVEEEKLYWIALSAVPGIGGRMLDRLMRQFGSPSEVFAAPLEELTALPRVTEQIVLEIRNMEERLEEVRAELEALSEEGVRVFTREEEGFPGNLSHATDCPPVLYVRGDMTEEDDFAMALVGSRNASEAGIMLTRQLAAEVVACGITVISGLATGIDTAAHQGALEAGGRTVGVLGSGIRVVYPAENYEMVETMTHCGAVVSELSPNARPSGPNLMARDRIISGLSLGVIVVEAGEKSGSVDTAQKAKRQHRPVWAVDWEDDEEAHAGNRQLLREGATALSRKGLAETLTVVDHLRACAASLLRQNAVDEKNDDPSQLALF